ncbi:hypothetical protein BH23VER1_BH23VER1_34090 [soil metagenome]
MSKYHWESTFTELFHRCIAKLKAGNSDFESHYTGEDREFLKSIGYKTREFFDFVEDYCDFADPSIESAILTASARRDYLDVVQGGKTSSRQLSADDLPPKDASLDGIPWLPRIIAKARAKLRGELHPDMMFGCGGDRQFLRTHDIHPADFLRAVWAAGDDDQKILDYIRR